MTAPAHAPPSAADPATLPPPAPIPHPVSPFTFCGRSAAPADRSRPQNGGRGRR